MVLAEDAALPLKRPEVKRLGLVELPEVEMVVGQVLDGGQRIFMFCAELFLAQFERSGQMWFSQLVQAEA